MPWKESRASDERLKSIAEVLSGDSTITDFCRGFGRSRKTGQVWTKRSGGAGKLRARLQRTASYKMTCTRPVESKT